MTRSARDLRLLVAAIAAIAVIAVIAVIALTTLAGGAFAQTARNPFAIAGGEGAVAPGGGALGLVLAWQSWFHSQMSAAALALTTRGSALWTLGAASFAYGVLHAAGPGHGKAVLSSYMVANEASLRRGLALSLLAALLQGAAAIALVAAAALLFRATATDMRRAGGVIETLGYLCVSALGARLVYLKGKSFFTEARRRRSRFFCEALEHESAAHGPGCAHALVFEQAAKADALSWRSAAGVVLAAGLRPCSGAILILVLTLSHGLLAAGVAAVTLMSLGAAITTGLLAAAAVYAKAATRRLAARRSPNASLLMRGVELLAAALVLCLGLALLAGSATLAGTPA